MAQQTQARALAGEDPERQAARIIKQMRAAVAAGDQHWCHALLHAIRLWPLPEEQVGDRTYRYLVGGEAFDWLLLAERLCEELDSLVPEDEVEELLFHGRFPEAVAGEDLQPLLGAKYRAHLNFVYGVRVETALQLAVLAEVHKERVAARIWENGHSDDEAFRRIYGGTRSEMLAEFRGSCHSERPGRPSAEGRNFAKESGEGQTSARRATPSDVSDALSLHDLSEFTYWLFRRRVQNSDPARVASDTRKGLAHYQRLETLRRSGAPAPAAEQA
ncbi:MAG: hypothetical protein Q7T33_01710 [Dehalococcoidia bacterium]|nr:hypothetical protein [Dehalococcoidia bacterium]